MIFQHTWQKVIDGSKTCTTRPKRSLDEKPRWHVGRSYAVQKGRGQRAIARIVITRIEDIRDPTDCSSALARAEGFASAEEYLKVWLAMYPKNPIRPCWRMTFELERRNA